MTFNNFEIFSLACVLLAVFNFQDSNAKPPMKIVGGDDATIEEFPAVVSLRIQNKHYCAGALITNKHILTAAHCAVVQYNGSDIYDFIYPTSIVTAHTGTNSSIKTENAHKIEKIHVHDLYTGSERSNWNNDIAILTLKDPIEPNGSQRPVALPSEDVKKDDEGLIVGWGSTTENSYLSGTLKKAFMKVVPNTSCEIALRGRIPRTQLCAINRNGIGFCDGDSGGPYIVNNEIVGIIANSLGCGIGYPDVYTRVYSYITWINKILEDEK